MTMLASRMSQYMPQAHAGSHFQSGHQSNLMLSHPSPTNSDFSEHSGTEDVRYVLPYIFSCEEKLE